MVSIIVNNQLEAMPKCCTALLDERCSSCLDLVLEHLDGRGKVPACHAAHSIPYGIVEWHTVRA